MNEILERLGFSLGLKHPWFFRKYIRKEAYKRANGDPEKVHEMALEKLNEHLTIIRNNSSYFSFPSLLTNLGPYEVMPIGTAAGLDKNADALLPFSCIFGFQEIGTVVLQQRSGNDRPRVAVDEEKEDLYNAQGFPSQGLNYALGKLKESQRMGRGTIFASVCGLPKKIEEVDKSFEELEELVTKLNRYVSGFVWNPFSPNTEALKALRTPEIFKKSAELIKGKIGGEPALVKMGPYEENMGENWLQLVRGFLDGGGDGIVTVNTYLVPKEKVPSQYWGYPSAGRSGNFLQDYRLRAVKDARKEFPNIIIVGVGGINSPERAWETLQYADAIEMYTPLTFHGLGLVHKIGKGLEKILHEKGFSTLREYRGKNNLSAVHR